MTTTTCNGQDCACWREGVRAAHNRIAATASADTGHAPGCGCAECDTIETVLLAAMYEAAHDAYLAEYRQQNDPMALSPADWQSWAELVATECTSACMTMFAQGRRALAIVESGRLARLVAERINRNAAYHRYAPAREPVRDIVRDTVAAAVQRQRAG